MFVYTFVFQRLINFVSRSPARPIFLLLLPPFPPTSGSVHKINTRTHIPSRKVPGEAEGIDRAQGHHL